MPDFDENQQQEDKYQNAYYKHNKYVPSHVNVDMGNKELGSVGGNLSTRMPIKYVDEKGDVINGFFTKNESVNAYSIFENRISRLYDTQKREEYKQVIDCFKNDCEKNGVSNTLGYWSENVGLNKDYFRDYGMRVDLDGMGSPSTTGKRKKLLSYLTTQGFTNEFVNSVKEKADFWRLISNIFTNAYMAMSLKQTHNGFHYQSDNTSINKRNNAMYEYAKLAGYDDLICKSSSMTVMKNNQKMEGTFMVNAIGTDCQNWDPRRKEMGKRKMEFTPEAIRDVSNLQIMDFLCGNVDRHGRNMFYNLDYSDPEKIKITGVQGIDNDASFGVCQYKEREAGWFTPITDIKVIDAEMYERIQKLKPEDIDAKIRLAGLSKEEIDAAHERLEVLKQNVEAGAILVINDPKRWGLFAKEMIGETYVQQLRRSDDSKNYANTFDNAALVVEVYNNNVEEFIHGKGRFANRSMRKLPAAPPVGIAKNTVEHNTVDVHKNELDAKQKELASKLSQCDKSLLTKELCAYIEQCKNVVDLMTSISARKAEEYSNLSEQEKDLYSFTLSDKERNIINEGLSDLNVAANKYLESDAVKKANKSKDEMFVENSVKNTIAYIGFAKESMQRDAIEAEKNFASKMFVEFAKEKEAAMARQNLPALLKRSSEVDSAFKRSSKEFKDMTALLKSLDGIKLDTIVQKQVVYNKLIDLSQKYIEHKLPEGKTEKDLNDYEKNRVAFAKDIIGFCDTCKLEAMQAERARARQNSQVKKVEAEKEKQGPKAAN